MNLSVPVTSYSGTFDSEGVVLPGVQPVLGQINFNSSLAMFGGRPYFNPNNVLTENFTGGGQIIAKSTTFISGPTRSDSKGLVFAGTTTVDDTLTLEGVAALAQAPSTTFAGNVTINWTLKITGGGTNVTFDGIATIATDAQVMVDGPLASCTLVINNNLSVNGTLTSGVRGNVIWLRGSISDNGTINNNGSFTALSPNGTITGNGVLNNITQNNLIGEMIVSSAVTFSVPFDNKGGLTLSTGTLTISNNWTQPANGTTNFLGGILQVDGDFTNNGTVNVSSAVQPPNSALVLVNTFINNATLTLVLNRFQPAHVGLTISPLPKAMVGGNFTQGNNALLVMNVYGLAAPDSLTVAGTATLAGGLTINVPGGTTLSIAQSWTLITANRISSRFSKPNVTLPALFQLTYANQSVSMAGLFSPGYGSQKSGLLLGAFLNNPNLNPNLLAVVAVNGNPNLVGTVISTQSGGRVLVLANGALFYTPGSGGGAATDTVDYSVSDGTTTVNATANINVTTDSMSIIDPSAANLNTSSSGILTRTTNATSTTTALVTSPNPAYAGQSVTLNATVSVNANSSVQAPTGWGHVLRRRQSAGNGTARRNRRRDHQRQLS